jgi:hypothetical protein
MAGTVDAFLKVSIAASLLLAAGSVGYYYSIYLPKRDAQIDRERLIERSRVEITEKAVAARLQAEKEEAESQAAAARLSAQVATTAACGELELNTIGLGHSLALK